MHKQMNIPSIQDSLNRSKIKNVRRTDMVTIVKAEIYIHFKMLLVLI